MSIKLWLEKKILVFKAKFCRKNQRDEGGDHIIATKAGLKELILVKRMLKKDIIVVAHQNEVADGHNPSISISSAGYAPSWFIADLFLLVFFPIMLLYCSDLLAYFPCKLPKIWDCSYFMPDHQPRHRKKATSKKKQHQQEDTAREPRTRAAKAAAAAAAASATPPTSTRS